MAAQLALLIDEKRSADVLALEMCDFAVVSRADYLAVVNEKHKTEAGERYLVDGHAPNMAAGTGPPCQYMAAGTSPPC